jgi:hypothetical protein
MERKGYDIIGDIHGHADELERLLGFLGYRNNGLCYEHPERKVIFVGDFIDRGPKIRETLQLVRAMMERGSALAVMGNHEYNALCFHTPDGKGGFLRENSEKNIRQHQKTLDAFAGRDEELRDYLRWFLTLPVWLDRDGLRVVHACWDEHQMGALGFNPRLDPDLLLRSAQKGSVEYRAIEVLLKGKEVQLPAGVSYTDKEGHERTEIRVKWWDSPQPATFRSMCFPASEAMPDFPLSNEQKAAMGAGYCTTHPPVFVGHYWVNDPEPTLLTANVACVDYSVAKSGGKLVAYCWDGENALSKDKFVSVTRGEE